MSEWVFAFFHLFLLLALLGYALFSLLAGNILRFSIIIICLLGYYFLVLHQPLKKEIQRKRKKD